jgi:carbamate kinase
MSKLAVIAIGGNSLIKDKQHQKVEDQYAAVVETAKHIVDMIEMGINVVVTHGNGPQVGFIMRRAEIAEEVEHMHPVPLYTCDADTQGAIGYQIQQALRNEFVKRRTGIRAVTLITQVEVDANDPAFENPSKPIGTFYDEDQIQSIREKHPDWQMVHDAGRGYRRVVPSPKPIKIVEKKAIEQLVRSNFCVIAVGGGGIPVVRTEDNVLEGVNAVIDKDNASSLLATNLEADYFIVSTAVDQVCINFNQPDMKALDHLNLEELRKYKEAGEFAPGSMLPKIEAVEQFIVNGGKKAIITSPGCLSDAVKGLAGTTIEP